MHNICLYDLHDAQIHAVLWLHSALWKMRHTFKINRWYTYRFFCSGIILLIMYCRGHCYNSFSFRAHTSTNYGGRWPRRMLDGSGKTPELFENHHRQRVMYLSENQPGTTLSSETLSASGSPRKQAQRRSDLWKSIGWHPQVHCGASESVAGKNSSVSQEMKRKSFIE